MRFKIQQKLSNMFVIKWRNVSSKIEFFLELKNLIWHFFRTHEETNAKRKLSAEQRREKKTKRALEDTASGVHAAVYRVRHLDDAAKRFKVETNCKQLQMTGCVVLCKDINIIAVEGGRRKK
jgi:uncharacterized protein YdaU (DUF1376 family)